MFKKTTCLLLLICILFMGCNSFPKPEPNPEPQPPQPAPPGPEMITKIIEVALEMAPDVAYELRRNWDSYTVLESYPHALPKKFKLAGTEYRVGEMVTLALGKDEGSDSDIIDEESRAGEILATAQDLSEKRLLTSLKIAEYIETEEHEVTYRGIKISAVGTKLGLKKIGNFIRNEVEAIVPAKPEVTKEVAKLLESGQLKRFAYGGDNQAAVYVAGPHKVVAELVKLGGDNK